jgi:drug/metabolite transporter (DMT)-like permease
MGTEKQIYMKGLSIAIIGVLVMSFDALLIRLSGTSGPTAVFYRAFFTFVSISIIFFGTKKNTAFTILKSGGFPMILSGIMWGLSGMGFTLGVQIAGAANTLVLISLAPLFAAAFSFLFYKKKPSLITIIAAIIAMFGIWYMYKDGFGDMDIEGLLYALATPLFLGSNLSYMRKHKSLNRLALVLVGGITGTILALIFAKGDVSIELSSLLPLAILGLFIIPFAQTMIGTGTKYIRAPEAALVNSSETVLGIFWVWLFLGETPQKNFLLGAAIVVFAITANSLYQAQSKK